MRGVGKEGNKENLAEKQRSFIREEEIEKKKKKTCSGCSEREGKGDRRRCIIIEEMER